MACLTVACTGEIDDGPTTESVGLRVQFELESDDDVDLTTLGVRIEEVVLVAEGPDGDVSLSVSADQAFSVLDPPADPPPGVLLALEPGRYKKADVEVHLREAGPLHALWGTGWLTKDDVPFDLEVRPELVLTADGSFDVDAEVSTVLWLELRPKKWFDGVDLDDVPAVLRLEPQSGEDYDRVVDNVIDSTKSRFDDGAGDEDGDEDD